MKRRFGRCTRTRLHPSGGTKRTERALCSNIQQSHIERHASLHHHATDCLAIIAESFPRNCNAASPLPSRTCGVDKVNAYRARANSIKAIHRTNSNSFAGCGWMENGCVEGEGFMHAINISLTYYYSIFDWWLTNGVEGPTNKERGRNLSPAIKDVLDHNFINTVFLYSTVI